MSSRVKSLLLQVITWNVGKSKITQAQQQQLQNRAWRTQQLKRLIPEIYVQSRSVLPSPHMANMKGNPSTSGNPEMEGLLQFPEDAGLNYASPSQAPIRRPQGIQTMAKWGDQRFPEGKHQNKSFQEVYNQDHKYRAFMMNHPNLTNAWALSFQNYVRAMNMGNNQMPIIAASKAIAAPMSAASFKGTTAPWKPDTASLEWELMADHLELSPPPKRSLSPEILENEGMTLDKDVEKEQAIMTKIAVLQRELDLMRKQTEK